MPGLSSTKNRLKALWLAPGVVVSRILSDWVLPGVMGTSVPAPAAYLTVVRPPASDAGLALPMTVDPLTRAIEETVCESSDVRCFRCLFQ